MPKPNDIVLATGERFAILYEDRSVLAIDKPRDWMLVPSSWQNTGRNLQAALLSSIAAGDFWARSRGLKYLRFVHRLDTETTGVLLLAKSQGALHTYSELFESRKMEKLYLAVVHGAPRQAQWSCELKLAPDPQRRGRMKADSGHGKAAKTTFQVLQKVGKTALIEAHPLTGRTHQIRLHLAKSGHPIVGDQIYGPPRANHPGLGLRAVGLAYLNPFTRQPIQIWAPLEQFLREYGFDAPKLKGSSE